MGKNSTEIVNCTIYMNVSNLFVDKVINEFSKQEFKQNLNNETNGYIKIIDIKIIKKKYLITSSIEIYITFSVDMYHVIREKKGKAVANIAKLFKKKRRNKICEEIKNAMEKKFKEKIDNKAGWLGFAANLAITFKIFVE